MSLYQRRILVHIVFKRLSGSPDGTCEALVLPRTSSGSEHDGLGEAFVRDVRPWGLKNFDRTSAWVDEASRVIGEASLVVFESIPPLIRGVKLVHVPDTGPIR